MAASNHVELICICGKSLEKILAKDCYISDGKTDYIVCNECKQLIEEMSFAYHCINEKIDAHPEGYDLCIDCGTGTKIITINNVCYCQSSLTGYKKPNFDRPVCKNCCKSIPAVDKYVYPCFNKQCVYKSMSTELYLLCSQCYKDKDVRNIDDNDNQHSLIFNKFVHSLSTIS